MKNEITKILILNEAAKMESKYCDLVWLARKSSKHDHIKGVLESKKRIAALYPNETIGLIDELAGDWNHGFNSGMLAGMRYILDIGNNGLEEAIEFFPDLNT